MMPRPVAAFFRAVAGRDADAVGALLAARAVVVDNGVERDFGGWLDGLRESSAELRILKASSAGGTAVVTTCPRVADAEAAARTVWTFTLEHDKVSALHVTDERGPDLPAPVAAFVRETNCGDLEGILAAFSDDAVVNDQLREHWHRPAIAEWAAREIVAPRLRLHVERVVCRYDQTILDAIVDGDFDKRGLPDPLVLTFYFSTRGDQIVQLLILRNERD